MDAYDAGDPKVWGAPVPSAWTPDQTTEAKARAVVGGKPVVGSSALATLQVAWVVFQVAWKLYRCYQGSHEKAAARAASPGPLDGLRLRSLARRSGYQGDRAALVASLRREGLAPEDLRAIWTAEQPSRG